MSSMSAMRAAPVQARNCPATTSRCTAGRSAAAANQVSLKGSNAFLGCNLKLAQTRLVSKAGASMPLVQAAATKETKAATIEGLKTRLESSAVVVGLNYQGMTVKDTQAFRRSLPADTEFVVTKNTLISKAGSEVEGFACIADLAKNDQAWVFIKEDDIASSMKALLKFQKQLHENEKKKEVAKITGAVMDGNILDSAAATNLKNLPTKTELITKIAIMINKPVTKIAVGINQVPSKVGYAARALKDKLEEEAGGAPAE